MKLKQLEVFRFIAAFLILVFHTNSLPSTTQNGYSLILFQSGTVWVNFFFVLSGFLLAYRYYGKKIEYKKYIIPKVIRLYMMNFIGFCISLLTTKFVLSLAIMFLSMTYLWSSIFTDYALSTYNPAAWYLSVYLLFLLIFPLIKKVFDNFGNKVAYITIFTYCIYNIMEYVYLVTYSGDSAQSAANFASYSPYTWILTFMLGISFGYLFVDMKKRNCGSLVISFTLFTILFSMFFPIVFNNLTGLFFAIFILLLSIDSGKISQLLSNKFFVYLGSISFSIYIIHFPIFLIFRESNISWVIYVVIVLLTAIIIHELFEKRLCNSIISLAFRNNKKVMERGNYGPSSR